jgi:hypothetical protein
VERFLQQLAQQGQSIAQRYASQDLTLMQHTQIKKIDQQLERRRQ